MKKYKQFKKLLRILYFKARARTRRFVIRLWLKIPVIRKRWIDDARWLLEDVTGDSEFAAWYAVELYDSHMAHKNWWSYESGSDIAQMDISYWSD